MKVGVIARSEPQHSYAQVPFRVCVCAAREQDRAVGDQTAPSLKLSLLTPQNPFLSFPTASLACGTAVNRPSLPVFQTTPHLGLDQGGGDAEKGTEEGLRA